MSWSVPMRVSIRRGRRYNVSTTVSTKLKLRGSFVIVRSARRIYLPIYRLLSRWLSYRTLMSVGASTWSTSAPGLLADIGGFITLRYVWNFGTCFSTSTHPFYFIFVSPCSDSLCDAPMQFLSFIYYDVVAVYLAVVSHSMILAESWRLFLRKLFLRKSAVKISRLIAPQPHIRFTLLLSSLIPTVYATYRHNFHALFIVMSLLHTSLSICIA